MAGLTAVSASPNEAPALASAVFATAAKGSRPLVIADHPHFQRTVQRDALKTKIGLRVLQQSDLTESLPPGNAADLPTLLNIDRSKLFRRTAKKSLLMSKIYLDLLRDSEIIHPMAMAKSCRDVLLELNDASSKPLAGIQEHRVGQLENSEEIALLQAMWEKYCQDDWEQQHARLTRLAHSLTAPVVHVQQRLHVPHLVNEFVAAAAQRQTVKQIKIEQTTAEKNLEALWATGQGQSKHTGTLHACHAVTQEDATAAALSLVTGWLDAGLERIGIFGFDRTLLRRLNSVCRSNAIYLSDRTGWQVSNLLIGDVLLAMAEHSHNSFSHRRLVQLIASQRNKATEAGSSWVAETRQLSTAGAATQFEEFIASYGWGTLTNQQPLAQWFGQLAQLAAAAPLQDFIADDMVGQRVVQLLNMLANTFAAEPIGTEKKISAIELRTFLHDAFSNTSLVTSDIDSNIQLLSLNQHYSEDFEAILLLGANATNLPRQHNNELFGDEVRIALGLPTQEMLAAEERHALASLLGRHEHKAVVWHGENLISPYLEMIAPQAIAAPRPLWQTKDAGSELVDQQSVIATELPAKLSVGSFDTLMDCPYKFHAERFWQLREDRAATTFNAAEFGTYVHNIVEAFHQRWQPESKNEAKELLRAITDEQLPAEPQTSDLVHKWLWEPYIDRYASRMQNFAIVNGTVKASEMEFKEELELTDGAVELVGKIDRLDYYANDDVYGVVDVKTGSITATDIASGERPQISLYAAAKNAAADKVAIWQLKSAKGIAKVDVLKPFMAKGVFYDPAEVQEHVRAVLNQILTQQPMPANGTTSVCGYCPMDGLCRRPLWRRATPAK